MVTYGAYIDERNFVPRGELRIIGGQWRGRKLTIPVLPGLRPTPDRVRETVFNWLSSFLPGAHCLDAFAGSGALGFEALSRGALSVTMVDASLKVIEVLKAQAKTLKTERVEIYQAHVPLQLRPPDRPFDVVFLDPPFRENVLLPTCFYLEEKGFLSARAKIYLEAPRLLEPDHLPLNWELIKNKVAGQVAYHLAVRKN